MTGLPPKLYTIYDKSLTLAEWSKETGVPPLIIRNRMNVGMSAVDAIMTPYSGDALSNSYMPEYAIWHGLKNRCLNDNGCNNNYKKLAEPVAAEYLEPNRGFENWLAEVGKKPGPGYTIERKVNSLGYIPGNMKWIPAPEQAANKTNTIYCLYKGEEMRLVEIAKLTGVPYSILRCRMRDGWTLEDAIEAPVQHKSGRPKTYITINKETKAVQEWSKMPGAAAVSTIFSRLYKGTYTNEEAVFGKKPVVVECTNVR